MRRGDFMEYGGRYRTRTYDLVRVNDLKASITVPLHLSPDPLFYEQN
jgi:hypothetical protein